MVQFGILSPEKIPPAEEEEDVLRCLFPISATTRVKIGRSFRFREHRSPRVSCIGNVVNKGGRGKERKRKNDHRGKERRNATAAPHLNQSLILKLLKVFKKKETKAANAEPSRLPPGGAYEKSAPKTERAKKIFNWSVRGPLSAVTPHPWLPISSKRRWGKRNEVTVVENIVLAPRKEINLWKKRMVAPPPPLMV
ncbi:hypothetical protein MLD38_007844 [Melastoma candidum]|uniref:Uncharacterized protein n=1 Tax=Melastoma candidum TaxID=119954 RepID=A0ACB9RSC8_9MYRT|nr:hypothetical protein MLD38_007844 [Melastoma candidum]